MDRTNLETLSGLDVAVAGRTFRPAVKTTIQQDLYVMSHVKTANLDKIAEHINPGTFKLDEYAEQCIVTAYQSGEIFNVLGGTLVEVGKKWSEQSAKENAEFFANLDEDADKEEIAKVVVSVVLHFFIAVVNGKQTFPMFSANVESPLTEKVERLSTFDLPASASGQPPRNESAPDNPDHAATPISENGITSSDNSPDTIPTTSMASSSGAAETP